MQCSCRSVFEVVGQPVQIWPNCISGFALGASQEVHHQHQHRQRCTRPLVAHSGTQSGGLVVVYWCTVPCVAEYTVAEPAPSAASKAGAARGEGARENPSNPKKFTMKAFHKFSQFNPYENKSIPINIAEVSSLNHKKYFYGEIARMLGGRMERCLGTLEEEA